MVIVEHTSFSHEASGRRYVRAPRPIHFPAFEEMPETNRHLELRTTLYLLLKHELSARATIGSDQFVYYDPTTAKKKLAPDAFIKLDVPHKTFRVWKTWQRGAPDLGVEVVSDSDEGDEDWDEKLERYRASGIGEVVRFDPDGDQPIRVWDHVDGDLIERERPEDGVHECACLGLFWVAVPHAAFGRMLRLARDRAGRDLLPTPEEYQARARTEEARARAEAERARTEEARARVEAERARTEEARARAEAERARTEEARARAEAEHARTEEARARAEAEHARTEEARARAEAEHARDALAAEVAELRRMLGERSKVKSRAPVKAPKRSAKRRA